MMAARLPTTSSIKKAEAAGAVPGEEKSKEKQESSVEAARESSLESTGQKSVPLRPQCVFAVWPLVSEAES